jgi:hypothetical protein
VIALGAAPHRGSSFPQEAACIGDEGLSFSSISYSYQIALRRAPRRRSFKQERTRLTRRGALFLINFLSKLLILGSPTEGRSTASPFGELSLIALLRPLSLTPRGAQSPSMDVEPSPKKTGPPARRFLRKPINSCGRASTSGPVTQQPIPCRVRQQGVKPPALGCSDVWRSQRAQFFTS